MYVFKDLISILFQLPVSILLNLLYSCHGQNPEISLCMPTANERWCYNVTSLIGWAHIQNDPWKSYVIRCFMLLLTHWGRATHIWVSKLTIIGSDNGLSPGRHQAIIWTITGILLNGPLGTNFSEILIGIQTFSFKKMHLKMSAKWRPFCLGPNVLTLLVLKQEYSGITKSIPLLLMSWLLVSPGHQQPWYWPYRTNRFLSSKGNYRKVSNIRHTKSQNLNASRLIL